MRDAFKPGSAHQEGIESIHGGVEEAAPPLCDFVVVEQEIDRALIEESFRGSSPAIDRLAATQEDAAANQVESELAEVVFAGLL